MEVNTLLDQEISRLRSKLEEVEPGSEEYSAINSELVKLVDRAIELEKVNNERADKAEQKKTNRVDIGLKHGLTLAGIIGSAAVTIWGVCSTFKFEKEGYIPTTQLGRGFFNKLISKN